MSIMVNPLASPEQLYRRSSLNALPSELLDLIFFSSQCLTQAAGLLLELPQSVTAQANVLLARFWLAELSMAHEFSDASAACIYLVAKMGSHPRSPRDVTNVYAYLLSPASTLFRPPNSPPAAADPAAYHLSEGGYEAARSRLLAAEARLLYALGFDTHAALPHALAVLYLQNLGLCGDGHSIAMRTIAHLNTALLSPQMLYLTHQPNALAVAAIYAAAADAGAWTPDCEWWEVFDVEREELGFLVVALRSLEGWGRKMREEMEAWTGGKGGMLTRVVVEGELRRRGLAIRNGHGLLDGAVDEEAEMMRKMDERMEDVGRPVARRPSNCQDDAP